MLSTTDNHGIDYKNISIKDESDDVCSMNTVRTYQIDDSIGKFSYLRFLMTGISCNKVQDKYTFNMAEFDLFGRFISDSQNCRSLNRRIQMPHFWYFTIILIAK